MDNSDPFATKRESPLTHKLEAVVIDRREPEWVQALRFGGLPVMAAELEYGDIQALCTDGCTLLIERKTGDDFLNTLREGRLFPQMAGLARARSETTWPYLLVTAEFRANKQRNVSVYKDKQFHDTGWDYAAVWGALLSVQEIGVPVVFTPLDTDVERAVFFLSNRTRTNEHRIMPAKTVRDLPPEAEFLSNIRAGDNRLGPDLAEAVMAEAGSVCTALRMLTDEGVQLAGIGPKRRAGIRKFFNLLPGENLWTTNS